LLSQAEHANILQKVMQFVMEYPLTLKSDNYYYHINDETKKTYLKYTDEYRKKIITGAKKAALLDAKKVNERIAEAIEKATTISNDEVDMAYLENQLYDFENEGRSR